MTLSKKYLCTVALALLCAAVFPSCKGDGGEDQPTPPPAEEKSLIASLTVKGRDEYRNSHSEYFYTYQYSYDEAGRVTSVALRGDDNEDYSFTYGDGMMTITCDPFRTEFLTDANGYIVRDKTGNYSASHDAEGHLLQLLWEGDNHTFKWEGDLLTEVLCSEPDRKSSKTIFVYSKTKDPTGGLLTYSYLGLYEGILPSMWLGKAPACLPSKVITYYYAQDGKQYLESTGTIDYNLDTKDRPVKVTETWYEYEYDQYKGKNPLPVGKTVSTFEITYK